MNVSRVKRRVRRMGNQRVVFRLMLLDILLLNVMLLMLFVTSLRLV